MTLALGLILGILMAFSFVTVASLGAVAIGRERLAANGLADLAMEQLRALPYATLAHGLDDGDLTTAPTDPAITACGTTPYCYRNEAIPHGTNTPSTYTQAPLVPHRSTLLKNNVTYTIATYPTLVSGSTTTIRATVVVSWTASANNGAVHSISSQSLFAAPTGCATGAGHPYVAPCQPFHYASGGVGLSHITASGTIGGLSVAGATIDPASVDSNLQAEQVTADNGEAIASGGSLAAGSPTSTQTAGQTRVSVHSDNDAATTSRYASATLAAQVGGTLTQSDGTGDSVSVTTSANDPGSAQSAAAATTPSNLCPDLGGVNQNDSQACGAGSVKQANGSSLAMVVAGVANPFTLASVAASTNPAGVFVSKDIAPDGSYCTATSGDGCVTARSTRDLGAMTFGGLPTGFSPGAGWTGSLVQISRYTDAVAAESGVGAAAPSVTISNAPVITAWNGAGYTSTTLTSTTPAGAIAVSSATATSGGVTVTISASLSTGGESVADPAAGCAAPCTRTSANAVAGAPVSGTITYTVTSSTTGATLASVTLSIDLGVDRVDTSYQPSPSIAP